ncbi:HD-GYP domain-containing protein [Desulforamulus ruminis]|uniref:Metal dependent phosphohydrolase n=1 Tax=Desulforamulus ruminis (strain ATCC 23193 / DSM 2154 / NCIMB 8452 / DL) TaxID=696281 RepID=F6DUK5_DESRL|nr:HD-GYP domain-containing protein [Desulforamulus ruminis]AEG59072.1 metal dependent phosphohydrolase [Desulforamulus ruminis DSM 2154]
MQKSYTTLIPELHKFTYEIMESSEDLITIIDKHGIIIAMNPALSKLLNIKHEQLLGQPLVEAVYGGRKFDFQGNYLSPIIETLETGREFKGKEMGIKSPLMNGSFVCLTTTGILRDSRGRLAAVYCYDKDLTLCRQLERTNEKLEELIHSQHLQTVLAFSEAIGARDNYTRGHSERVAEYAQMITRAMGLDDLDQLVYVAALVHDVGKIGIPEHILNKQGRLTDEEYQKIKEHPVTGANILKQIGTFNHLVPIVRAHHERYDGRGYPDGLAKEEIPLISRIIGVADAFEAMTSDRSYRKGFTIEQAVEELKCCSGSQFDPQVVKHFLRLIAD